MMKNNIIFEEALKRFSKDERATRETCARDEIIAEFQQPSAGVPEENPMFIDGFFLQPFKQLVTLSMSRIESAKIKKLADSGYGIRDNKGNTITNFLVEIAEVKTNEGDIQEIEFVVSLKNGLKIPMTKSVDEFRSGSWFAYDARLHCDNLHELKAALELLLRKNEVVVFSEYHSPGWYEENGKWNYFNCKTNVLGEQSCIKIVEENAGAYKVNEREENLAIKFWEMQNLTRGPQALIVMAYVILASLYSIFKAAGLLPKGVLALIGPQSTRKTSLALVLGKLLERSESMTPKYNMRSTPTSIDEALEDFKDSVLIVDDLSPSEDSLHRRELERTLEHVVRIFGDANTRQRSKNYAKAYEPKGLAILTGEYMNAVASTLSRMIILQIDTDTVDLDVLSYYQKNHHILPGFLWNFLTFCAKNQMHIIDFLKARFVEKRLEVRGKYNPDRLGEYRVELELAMEILLMYLKELNCFDSGILTSFASGFSFEIDCMLKENQRLQSVKQPFSQVVDTIKWLVLEERIYNLPEMKVDVKQDFYKDDKFFYLYPTAFLKSIEAYAAKCGESTSIYNISYLETVLENNDAIICKDEVKIKGTVCKRRSLKLPKAGTISDYRRFYVIPQSLVYAEGKIN